MRTCKTCAHWGAPDQREKADSNRTCKAVPHDARGACRWDAHDIAFREEDGDMDDEDRAMLAAPAVVVDGSGYSAELRTRAEFGCTLYLAEEAEAVEAPKATTSGVDWSKVPEVLPATELRPWDAERDS